MFVNLFQAVGILSSTMQPITAQTMRTLSKTTKYHVPLKTSVKTSKIVLYLLFYDNFLKHVYQHMIYFTAMNLLIITEIINSIHHK